MPKWSNGENIIWLITCIHIFGRGRRCRCRWYNICPIGEFACQNTTYANQGISGAVSKKYAFHSGRPHSAATDKAMMIKHWLCVSIKNETLLNR